MVEGAALRCYEIFSKIPRKSSVVESHFSKFFSRLPENGFNNCQYSTQLETSQLTPFTIYVL